MGAIMAASTSKKTSRKASGPAASKGSKKATAQASPSAPRKMSVTEISDALSSVGYIPTRQIAFAAAAAVNNNVPVLLEGAAGVGKTQLAKSVADMLSLPLVRVQFYEGLTSDQLLFDYDYQRQLLSIQAISSTLSDELSGKGIDDAMSTASKIDFYSRDFLIERPLLRSINGDRCVLLLDEVDKSSEEIEYALLEFLEGYSISIPQLGTVTCDEESKPIVFLTSNRYRELSDALKRRCAYLYIPQKSEEEVYEILRACARADEGIVAEAAEVLSRLMSDAPLKRAPSIAEGIDWVNTLHDSSFDPQIDIEDTLATLLKSHEDIDWMRSRKDLLDGVVDAWSRHKHAEYGL